MQDVLTVASPTLRYPGANASSVKVSLLPNPSHLGVSAPLVSLTLVLTVARFYRGGKPRCTRKDSREAVCTAEDFASGL